MPDYHNSKIYRITTPSGADIYIGSTTLPLEMRFYLHRQQKIPSLKALLEEPDVFIELIEEYPCQTPVELHKREGHWIQEYRANGGGLNVVNRTIPGRTPKEYYQQTKRQLQYYYQHKDRILERQREQRAIRRGEHLPLAPAQVRSL